MRDGLHLIARVRGYFTNDSENLPLEGGA